MTAISRFYHALLLGCSILPVIAQGESPVANAGPDRLHWVRKPLRLDGTMSKGAGTSALPLIFKWSFVSKPVGSQAYFTDIYSPRPTFIPDVAGTYVVQLVVQQGSSVSPPDVVRFSVDPLTPYHLVETRVAGPNTSCIELDSQDYCPSDTTVQGVFVLALDRTTLDVLDQKIIGTVSGQDALTNYLNAATGGQILILTTEGGGVAGVGAPLYKALSRLGASVDFQGISSLLDFTFVGIPGLQGGQGWEIGGPTSDLKGQFVLDSQNNFTFAQFDYVKYELIPSKDLSVPTAITIGTAPLYKPNPSNPKSCTGAFFLVAADRATLAPVVTDTFWTNCPSETDDASEQARLTAKLASFDDGSIVFLASWGSPQKAKYQATFAQLSQQIQNMGGTYEALLNVNWNNQGAYSFVGAVGHGAVTPTAAEASTFRTPKLVHGILRGILGRGNQGAYYRCISTSLTQSADLDFLTFVAQPTQAWPVPTTPGQQAAFNWIGQQLCGSCTNLRHAYTDTNIAITDWLSQLNSMTYPQGQSFSSDDFSTVHSQLSNEFRHVANIQRFQSNITSLWTEQQTNFGLIVPAVTAKVKAALQPPPPSPARRFLDYTIETAIGLAETTLSDKIVDVVKEEVKLAIPSSIVQAVLSGGATLAKDAAGNSAEATPSIDDTVANLESRTAYRFTQQLSSLGTMFDLILTDWGRMSGIGTKLANPDNVQWNWNGSVTSGQLLNEMTFTMEVGLYRSLMGTVYHVNHWDSVLNYKDRPDDFDDGNDTIPNHPYTGWPQNAYIQSLSPPPAAWYVIWLDKANFNKGAVNNLLGYIFAPASPGTGLGVWMPDLFRNWGMPNWGCVWHSGCFPPKSEGGLAPAPQKAVLKIEVTSVAKTSGAITVTLKLTNTGNALAQGVRFTQIAVRTLTGTGAAVVQSPVLPASVGDITVGSSASIPVTIQIPSTVSRISLTETGTLTDLSSASAAFTASQMLIP